MCPVCLTTAAILAGSATSTGGLAAVALRKLHLKKHRKESPLPMPSTSVLQGSSAGAGALELDR